MKTKIDVYKNEKDAEHEINKNTKKGWIVESIQQAGGTKQKVGKTVGIGVVTGILFTPLIGIASGALFGKGKKREVTVVYSIPENHWWG